MKDGRSGKVMGIPDTMDQDTWEIFQLSAATLLESIYLCVRLHPDNPYVKLILTEGIPDVCIIKMMTPADARAYAVYESNKLVGMGAVTSFMEKINQAPDVQKAWVADRRRSRESQNADSKKASGYHDCDNDADNAGTKAGDTDELEPDAPWL